MSSFVMVFPEGVAATVGLLPAAAEEVSVAVARLFGGFGQEFQELGAQAALAHERLVQALKASSLAYAGAEAANVSSLQGVAAGIGVVGGGR